MPPSLQALCRVALARAQWGACPVVSAQRAWRASFARRRDAAAALLQTAWRGHAVRRRWHGRRSMLALFARLRAQGVMGPRTYSGAMRRLRADLVAPTYEETGAPPWGALRVRG